MAFEPREPHRKRNVLIAVIAFVSAIFVWLFGTMKPEDRKTLFKRSEDTAHDTYARLVHFLVPHHGNDYKPHIFRTRSVRNILLLVLVVKVGVVSLLFVLYPSGAKLNQDVRAAMYGLINGYRIERGGN